MKKEELVEALVEALQDENVSAAIAKAIGAKPVSRTASGAKSRANTGENELAAIKKHVIFAGGDSPNATYMTTKEVMAAILEFDPELDVRPRAFGKVMAELALESKSGRTGKAYFIEAVVDQGAEDYVAEEAAEEEEAETSDDTKEESKKDKKSKKGKKKAKKAENEPTEDELNDAEDMPTSTKEAEAEEMEVEEPEEVEAPKKKKKKKKKKK